MKILKKSHKEALYRRYAEKNYKKYKNQFPKWRQSQIVDKIVRQWNAFTQEDKVLLFKTFVGMEGRDFIREQKEVISEGKIEKNTKRFHEIQEQLDTIYPQFQMEEKKRVRTFKDYQDGRRINNLGSCYNWVLFSAQYIRFLNKNMSLKKKMCLSKVRWHLIHLQARLRQLGNKNSNSEIILIKRDINRMENVFQEIVLMGNEIQQEKVLWFDSDFTQEKVEQKEEEGQCRVIKAQKIKYRQRRQITTRSKTKHQRQLFKSYQKQESQSESDREKQDSNVDMKIYIDDFNYNKDAFADVLQKNKFIPSADIGLMEKEYQQAVQRHEFLLKTNKTQIQDYRQISYIQTLKQGYKLKVQNDRDAQIKRQCTDNNNMQASILQDFQQLIEKSNPQNPFLSSQKYRISEFFNKERKDITQNVRKQFYGRELEKSFQKMKNYLGEQEQHVVMAVEKQISSEISQKKIHQIQSLENLKQMKTKLLQAKYQRNKYIKSQKTCKNQLQIRSFEMKQIIHDNYGLSDQSQSQSVFIVEQHKPPPKVKKTKKERQDQKNRKRRDTIRKIRLQYEMNPQNEQARLFIEKNRLMEREKARRKRNRKKEKQLQQNNQVQANSPISVENYFEKIKLENGTPQKQEIVVIDLQHSNEQEQN